MPTPIFSVIVPNWNGQELLPDLFEALAKQRFRGFETIIVDNASTDGSLELLAGRDDVRVERLTSNRGFTGAVTRGAEVARGELLVLLNSDMYPLPGFLEELSRAALEFPAAGSFACRVLFRDDPERIDSAGDRLTPSGRSVAVGRDRRGAEDELEPDWVFGGTGGAVVYRRELFAELGGLDDDFFLYVEDTDLAFRAQLAGFPCRYVPTALAHHVGSASLRGQEDRRARYCLRNYLYFLVKNYPAWLFVENAPEVLRQIRKEIAFTFTASRVHHGGLRALALTVGTLGQAVIAVPSMLRKRWQTARRIPNSAVEALFR